MSSPIEIIASLFFALAVLHTFAVKRFQHIASTFPEGSIGENVFHLMGEVEIVFGLWAGAFVAVLAALQGGEEAIHYVESFNFTEPAFVFVIMTIASTRPIVGTAFELIMLVARVLPLPRAVAFYVTALIIGPLLGSLITEPAAMTVTALILRDAFFQKDVTNRFRYLTLAVLFVNISIGGVLTHFAAPPVVMVAAKWNWGMKYMFATFGWKAILATVTNTVLASVVLRREFSSIRLGEGVKNTRRQIPLWLTSIHFLFLAWVVVTSHHPVVFLSLFLFFQGIIVITQEYQDELKLKESLLVGFFLGGLIVLGGLQGWWLKPFLTSLSELPLFLGATILTAVVDNAALTFLGTQVSTLGEPLKFALVSGAVSGGGLTIIANAPNPAGFAILRDNFGSEGISPTQLFLYALLPTLVAMSCFWGLPGGGG